MDALQFDIFISHAHGDREEYILPLARSMEKHGITFWLDTVEIGWGQDFVAAIDRGLSSSRYMLFCLSRNFLERRWPEVETVGDPSFTDERRSQTGASAHT